MQETTIAAIATAPGAGGIAVVRLSGAESYQVAARVFCPANAAKKVVDAKGYTAMYGTFREGDEAFDEGVALFFRAPHSYTGEDVVELSCHGGSAVARRLVEACLAAGAQPAAPGEYTRRAFLNGKLGLTQAEAVMGAGVFEAEIELVEHQRVGPPTALLWVVEVVGPGTIGLLAMQCALALGAKSVTAIDINDDKLALAKTLGATQVFNSRTLSTDDILNAQSDSRFDQLVLETAGTPQTVSLAIDIAGPHAQVALVGTLHHDLNLSAATFGKILRKELTLLGSWMNYSAPWPGEEWETAVRLLTGKKLQLEPLIAHTGDSESFAQAVQALNGAPMQGKIMLRFA